MAFNSMLEFASRAIGSGFEYDNHRRRYKNSDRHRISFHNTGLDHNRHLEDISKIYAHMHFPKTGGSVQSPSTISDFNSTIRQLKLDGASPKVIATTIENFHNKYKCNCPPGKSIKRSFDGRLIHSCNCAK